MLRASLPNGLKVNITIDVIRLKSKLTNKKSIRFTKKSFFYTIFSFTQSQLRVLGNIERFFNYLAGNNKSIGPNVFTGIDKVHLKVDCINGSIVNGIREPFLYNFCLSSAPGHKINNQPRIKLFKKINKPVLSHITFCLDDDRKPVEIEELMEKR